MQIKISYFKNKSKLLTLYLIYKEKNIKNHINYLIVTEKLFIVIIKKNFIYYFIQVTIINFKLI